MSEPTNDPPARDDGYDHAAPALPDWRAAPPAGAALCFAPHPDDEVIGPGGALALHVQQGDAVAVVVATDGTAGDPDGIYPRETYPHRRRDESRRGLACLGVDDVAFWGYPDSCVVAPADLDAIAARVVEAVERHAPATVYLPWPGEMNSDHRALYRAACLGLARVGFVGEALGYEVWSPMTSPDVLLDITAVADVKRRAVRCYESQVAYVDYVHPIFGLHAHRSLWFRRGRGWCEAYASIDPRAVAGS